MYLFGFYLNLKGFSAGISNQARLCLTLEQWIWKNRYSGVAMTLPVAACETLLALWLSASNTRCTLKQVEERDS